jgi:hypothetical protein
MPGTMWSARRGYARLPEDDADWLRAGSSAASGAQRPSGLRRMLSRRPRAPSGPVAGSDGVFRNVAARGGADASADAVRGQILREPLPVRSSRPLLLCESAHDLHSPMKIR